MSRPRATDWLIVSAVFCFFTGLLLTLPGWIAGRSGYENWVVGINLLSLGLAVAIALLFVAAVVRFGRKATGVGLLAVALLTLALLLVYGGNVYSFAVGQVLAMDLLCIGEAAHRYQRLVTPRQSFQRTARVVAIALTLGWLGIFLV